MTIEYHQSILANISDQDPDLSEAAGIINQYTEMCKSGKLSSGEYIELVEDIQRQINIRANMSALENLQMMNTAINGLLTVARAF
jgi:tape measure domain-containing protein